MLSPSPLERYLAVSRNFDRRPTAFDDLPRRPLLARLRRRHSAGGADGFDAPIVIRPAAESDGAAIARLAQLDGHPLPAGLRLLAESDGRIVAAAEVESGVAVSDPFVQSAGVVSLLRLRASQVRPARLV